MKQEVRAEEVAQEAARRAVHAWMNGIPPRQASSKHQAAAEPTAEQGIPVKTEPVAAHGQDAHEADTGGATAAQTGAVLL